MVPAGAAVPQVRSLPHFLKDGDTLTRDLSRLKLKKHHCNLNMDIVRLYPSLDLSHVISTLDDFFAAACGLVHVFEYSQKLFFTKTNNKLIIDR